MSERVNKWKLIAGLLLVLFLGIIAGAAGTGLYVKYRLAPFQKGPKSREAIIIEKLSKELDLTPNQKTKIRPVVEQMIEKRHEFYQKYRPEVKAIMDQGFSQIKDELNEDQKKKLDLLREKFEKRRAERRARQLRK
jgi:Spy/CpxP family protein refolding chaperone